jgi:integrase
LHDLRHTAATRLGRHANIRVVQRLLRHDDPATTAKYLHAFDDDVRAAMDAESEAHASSKKLDRELDRSGGGTG